MVDKWSDQCERRVGVARIGSAGGVTLSLSLTAHDGARVTDKLACGDRNFSGNALYSRIAPQLRYKFW